MNNVQEGPASARVARSRLARACGHDSEIGARTLIKWSLKILVKIPRGGYCRGKSFHASIPGLLSVKYEVLGALATLWKGGRAQYGEVRCVERVFECYSNAG